MENCRNLKNVERASFEEQKKQILQKFKDDLNILKLIRPEQWAKNFFVFLPLFFSGQLLNVGLLLQCVVAFFAFSFSASSIYCFNDIYDVEADRQHPKKCKRPIASGKISVITAYAVMMVCFTLSMAILFLFGGEEKFPLIWLIAFYFVMNIACMDICCES